MPKTKSLKSPKSIANDIVGRTIDNSHTSKICTLDWSNEEIGGQDGLSKEKKPKSTNSIEDKSAFTACNGSSTRRLLAGSTTTSTTVSASSSGLSESYRYLINNNNKNDDTTCRLYNTTLPYSHRIQQSSLEDKESSVTFHSTDNSSNNRREEQSVTLSINKRFYNLQTSPVDKRSGSDSSCSPFSFSNEEKDKSLKHSGINSMLTDDKLTNETVAMTTYNYQSIPMPSERNLKSSLTLLTQSANLEPSNNLIIGVKNDVAQVGGVHSSYLDGSNESKNYIASTSVVKSPQMYGVYNSKNTNSDTLSKLCNNETLLLQNTAEWSQIQARNLISTDSLSNTKSLAKCTNPFLNPFLTNSTEEN